MPDGFLSVDHGHVALGGKLVPGILVSMGIDGSVRFDEAQVDNLSGKKKTPMGWEDAAVTIELALTSDDDSNCYEKLAVLNGIFKGLDAGSNPRVYSLSNAHATARGVDQVVFSGLRSSESNDDDVITASLAFAEHNPPTIPPEVRSAATAEKESGNAPAADSSATSDPAVTADTDSPFSSGFQAGVS